MTGRLFCAGCKGPSGLPYLIVSGMGNLPQVLHCDDGEVFH